MSEQFARRLMLPGDAPSIVASPGGADTQIQYNSSGSFAGLSTWTTDGTSMTIGGGTLFLPSGVITIRATGGASTVGFGIDAGSPQGCFFDAGSGTRRLKWSGDGSGNTLALDAFGTRVNIHSPAAGDTNNNVLQFRTSNALATNYATGGNIYLRSGGNQFNAANGIDIFVGGNTPLHVLAIGNIIAGTSAVLEIGRRSGGFTDINLEVYASDGTKTIHTDGGTAGGAVGFFDAAAITQQSAITKPAGGATIDAEARTAIDALIDLVSEASGGFGLTA